MPLESPPRVLGKRYRLGELLREGASGTVFAAVDLMLGRSIAVKCMKLPHEGGLSLSTHDFVSEAQTIASLKHAPIIDIYDVGIEDDGRPYFVMELVGETLRDVLTRRACLGLEELLALLLPLCGALACAHELGIVHCDVKPEIRAAFSVSAEAASTGKVEMGADLKTGVRRVAFLALLGSSCVAGCFDWQSSQRDPVPAPLTGSGPE